MPFPWHLLVQCWRAPEAGITEVLSAAVGNRKESRKEVQLKDMLECCLESLSISKQENGFRKDGTETGYSGLPAWGLSHLQHCELYHCLLFYGFVACFA